MRLLANFLFIHFSLSIFFIIITQSLFEFFFTQALKWQPLQSYVVYRFKFLRLSSLRSRINYQLSTNFFCLFNISEVPFSKKKTTKLAFEDDKLSFY